MNRLLLLSVVAGFVLAGCSEPAPAPPPPPPPPVTDMAPVGEGLKVFGFAFLGAAVVLTLGKLLPISRR